MIDIPPDLQGIEIEIEMEGGEEARATELRKIFDGEDEDVVFSHAFGGTHLIAVVATLTASTLTKFAGFFTTIKTNTPKTKLRIGKDSIVLDGLSGEEMMALFDSPGFHKTVAGVRKK